MFISRALLPLLITVVHSVHVDQLALAAAAAAVSVSERGAIQREFDFVPTLGDLSPELG